MNELQAVVEAWARCRQAGEIALLATVVRTEGSTYRRPGARMLFTANGWQAGSISGGCLESDILQTAWQRTQNGPALVTYDSTSNEDIVWGFGLGCNGVVQVLLERLDPNAAASSASYQSADLLLAFDSNTEKDTADSSILRLDVLRFIETCLERREEGVVATVLSAEGYSYASVGSRLMVSADGTCVGDLRVESLTETILRAAKIARQEGKAFTRRYALSRQTAKWEEYPAFRGEEANDIWVEVGFERILPPRPLVIFGAGHDALPVADLAKRLGWHVTVVDPRSLASTASRFAIADAVAGCTPDALPQRLPLNEDTFTLLMTHNFLHDAAFLGHLFTSPARYIGVLGPKKRLERLLQHLEEEEGLTPTVEQRARLHGPVGLDIGADNPDEIALSILAEMQAIASNRIGGALRERAAPLHAESAPALLEEQTLPIGERFSCGLSLS